MTNRIFRVDVYPQDWLIDTSKLTPDVRGNFVQIVMLIYAQGRPILNDPKWISGVCGCSPRLVRSHVDKLVKDGFLSLTPDGLIDQKRASKELETKRKNLELASNAGRTSAEMRRESSKNKGITSTSSPSPPLIDKPSTSQQESPRGKDEVLKFDVKDFFDDKSLARIRKELNGWCPYMLAGMFNEKVRSGSFKKPDAPIGAMIAWAKKYTKGKSPS